MAGWDDGWGDGDYFDNSATPSYEDLLFGDTNVMDQHAQDLFIDAYIGQPDSDGVRHKDDGAYIELVEYMWDQYGIDWEEVYDWEDFREWYNAQ